MGTTFADYCATADAREKIAANVLEWSQMLCLSLEQNFVEESIRRQKFFAAGSPEDGAFYEKRIAELRDGKGCYKFEIETGRKYYKIMMETESQSRSVHAFVDKKTGELYKAASWKSPAKGVRFDLRIIEEREFVFKNCDWAGGYLYKN